MRLNKEKKDGEREECGKGSGFLQSWTQITRRLIERKNTLSKLVRNKSVKEHFQDYCESTSIHGIRYLGEEGRPMSERICWIVIFICCFGINGYLIRQTWNKWNDNPVIVSFAETTTPVWNVPFPAVTICSETKSKLGSFNFTDHYRRGSYESNDTDDGIKRKIEDVSLLCDNHILYKGERFADRSDIEFLKEVSPPFEEMFWKCEWGDVRNCSQLFTPILTQDGFCYTFNMLDKSDLLNKDPFPYLEAHGNIKLGWSLDGGYTPEAQSNAYPKRAFSAGIKSALVIQLRSHIEDKDFYCRGPVPGFKVLLHNPAEIPLVAERYLRAPLNQEIVAVIQPNIMTTSPTLLDYPSDKRQCYFPAERTLSYFKVYTQRNCELECLTNFTRRTCGCVGLHMPRREGTKVCGAGNKGCMIVAAGKLRMKEVDASYKDSREGSCDCLPACTSIQYNSENTQASFDVRSYAQLDEDDSLKNFTMSRITIFFKDMQFTTSRRSELFGTVDFMANCGGLLGLFCGMSFLSILEVIYYITLRIYGNLKAKKKREGKHAKEQSREAEIATITSGNVN